ncbi:MAG TPA: HTTM domain-containing protein [Gemmatimonadaceae bacterium]|nr:HTTM domain-containing protein [Gemmatimonadaceae bacterium]
MDIRASLLKTAPIPARQFALFRIAFGAYLAIHFAQLIPWGPELFSREGTLGNAELSPLYGVFPNVLSRWDSPAFATALLTSLVVLSVLFALGLWRRFAAVALWYGWACLFNRNPLISNPSIAYVGLLLLLSTLVPARERWRIGARSRDGGDEQFEFPAWVLFAAWTLMAVGYTYSGIVKLLSPSWLDGTAIWHVLNSPLARDGWLRDAMVGLPMSVFRAFTWSALALELAFLPLALWSRTRPFVWLAMAGMHIGIVLLVSFADLSIGMLMLHVFTYDAAWGEAAGRAWRGWRARGGARAPQLQGGGAA